MRLPFTETGLPFVRQPLPLLPSIRIGHVGRPRRMIHCAFALEGNGGARQMSQSPPLDVSPMRPTTLMLTYLRIA